MMPPGPDAPPPAARRPRHRRMPFMPAPDTRVIAEKFAPLEPVLDERARRLWAAAEARAIGRGVISRVAEATGMSRITIRTGLRELHPPSTPISPQAVGGRTRRQGGGRKPLAEH